MNLEGNRIPIFIELLINGVVSSLEGVWEGFFIVRLSKLFLECCAPKILNLTQQYAEFTSYVELLHGAPPQIFHRSTLGRHQQTWKLREHHLVTRDLRFPESGVNLTVDGVKPLPAGDPLRSFFPTDTHIREHPDGLLVSEPGRKMPLHYQRSTRGQPGSKSCVQDVIVTGEVVLLLSKFKGKS